MKTSLRCVAAFSALIAVLIVLSALSIPVTAGNSSDGERPAFGLIQAGSGTLTGIVKDKDNRSVNGAQVILSQGAQAIAEANTGSDGSFSFSELEGTYNLTVNYTGYELYTKAVTIVAGQTTDLGFIMLTPVPNYFWVMMDIIMVVGVIMIFLVVGTRVRKL